MIAATRWLMTLVSVLASATAFASASETLHSKETFCSDVQSLIVATSVEATNTIHAQHRAFVLSKPSVKPLATHQHEPADGEPGAAEGMISCKMKTADHLRTVYGSGAAGKDIGCDGVMRVIADAALLRHKRGTSTSSTKIEFRPEHDVDNGDDWLAPLKVIERTSTGTLRIRTRGLRKDWLDPLYAEQREEIRGVRYCHLVAPWFLDRVLSGEVVLEAGR